MISEVEDLNGRMLVLIEPLGAERDIAVKMCRVNSNRHPETKAPLDYTEGQLMWQEWKFKLPRAKWLWVWNNAPHEYQT